MATTVKGKPAVAKEKEKKDDGKSGKETGKELMRKLDETDEMKLKMLAQLDIPASSADALFPPELNSHLIEQLKIMTCENNELRKCVYTKDQEMKELNKIITDLNQRIRDIISGSGPAISSKSAGIISAKITDLCKQNRHLVAELEGLKTKNASLERKILQLEIQLKEAEGHDVCFCKDEPIDTSPDEMKELNNKLAAVNRKLLESKNRNLELKNEIVIATKILQKELGEKFTSIKELQSDMASWKGRAQQIVILQSKVSELEKKLKEKENVTEPKKKDRNYSLQSLRDAISKKKKQSESDTKNFEMLQEENRELRQKLDGAKSRIKNLECDVTITKQKMQTFAEKSVHDDMLVNEQRNQIKNLEIYYQDLLKENTRKMNKMQSEIAEYQKIVANTDSKIDALRKQTSEKAAKIQELRGQLKRYEECSLQSVFFTPMKTASDNEIKKLSELVKTLNNRLETERHRWDDLDTAHRKLKEKKKRLERRAVIAEEELKMMKEERSRKFSRSSKTSLDKKIASSIASRLEPSEEMTSETDTYENLDKEELKFKLELVDEKLKIMEDKLKMVEEEKVDDYNHLTEMIQDSKKLFNEALSVLQREKCICCGSANTLN